MELTRLLTVVTAQEVAHAFEKLPNGMHRGAAELANECAEGLVQVGVCMSLVIEMPPRTYEDFTQHLIRHVGEHRARFHLGGGVVHLQVPQVSERPARVVVRKQCEVHTGQHKIGAAADALVREERMHAVAVGNAPARASMRMSLSMRMIMR